MSDHLPVGFCLNVADVSATQPGACNTVVRDFRWDKGNLDVYYDNTRRRLSCIKHDFHCDNSDVACEDSSHQLDIEIYYTEIVQALCHSTYDCIPHVPRSALKHYWSAALDDLKANSKDSFDMWKLCGKPTGGAVYDLMKDAKYKYKLAVRQAIRTYEGRFSDELYEHLLSKDMSSFWKVWSSKTCNKVINVSCIDGEADDHKIAEIFASNLVNLWSKPVLVTCCVMICAVMNL